MFERMFTKCVTSIRQERVHKCLNTNIVKILILPTAEDRDKTQYLENKEQEDNGKVHEQFPTKFEESIEQKYHKLHNEYEKLNLKYKNVLQLKKFKKHV